jgi:integrase
MATVNHVHTALNKLFNDAERKGLVNKNVVRVSTHPTLTTARAAGPEMAVWAPEELTTFLRSIAGNRNEAMFRLAALTGMRRGELVGLRWRDVDLSRRRLTVNQSVTVVAGVELASVPKTRRSRRAPRPRRRDRRRVAAAPVPAARAVPPPRRDRHGQRPRVHDRPR